MGSTTADKVQELAKKYLDPENVAIVVVGEARQIQPELEKVGKVELYDLGLNKK
jgi:predicted Zn-dependent peptidase